MDKLVLELEPNTQIIIDAIGGDLRLSGWEQNQLHAEGDEESLRLEKHNGHLKLKAAADCTVRVPRHASVTVRSVGGDARVKSLDGLLRVESVGGSLGLRQVGAADIARVGGDLSAKKINGHLRVENVGGDAWARGVGGEFHGPRIASDLYLRDVQGSISASAGGDVTLSVDFEAGKEYSVQASSDIICRLAQGRPGKFEIVAAGDISVDVPDAQVEGEPGRRTVTLGGGGEVMVSLYAGGEVLLTGQAADPDSMGDFGERFGEDFGVMAEELAAQIESQIESQMADMERTLGERLAGLNVHIGGSRAEEIAAKARRIAQRVEEKAHRKADAARRRGEAAQRRAERQTERAQRLAEAASRRRGGTWAFKFDGPRPPTPPSPPGAPRGPRPPAPPMPPMEPVTDEERMLILRMVEQGKISVGEAEKLLAALESR